MVVRDALMQPVRKVLSATHFKEVCSVFIVQRQQQIRPADLFGFLCLLPMMTAQVQAPSAEDPSKMITKLTPCSPGDRNAKEMTWSDVEGDQLQEPILGLKDFLRAISSVRTISFPDLNERRRWSHIVSLFVFFLFCSSDRRGRQ